MLFVTVRYPAGQKVVSGAKRAAGDYNDFVDRNTQVTKPLVSAGYKLVNPNDNTTTQAMGGRLDGFFRDVPTGTVCGGAGTGEFADDATTSPKVST